MFPSKLEILPLRSVTIEFVSDVFDVAQGSPESPRHREIQECQSQSDAEGDVGSDERTGGPVPSPESEASVPVLEFIQFPQAVLHPFHGFIYRQWFPTEPNEIHTSPMQRKQIVQQRHRTEQDETAEAEVLPCGWLFFLFLFSD